MARTRIEWCDWTWNPVWGCRGGCPYCYARRIAKRFALQVAGRDDFAPTWIEGNFAKPFPKKPSRIFVNSMSDICFWRPEWLAAVLGKILLNPQHTFIFLSKDYQVYYRWEFPPNCWLGLTVTNQSDVYNLLSNLPGTLHSFLSIEPVLGPIDVESLLNRGLAWIIVGAETGNRRERVVPELAWLQGIYDFAREHGIPLFFKDSLRSLWPGELPREFPEAPRG